MTQLKIYSNPNLLKPGQPHVVMLHPFWGKNPEDQSDPRLGRFDDYTAKGQEIFQITSLEEADLAIFPLSWQDTLKFPENMPLANQFFQEAKTFGKIVGIFFLDDSDKPLNLENSLVFRTSLLASTRPKNEFAMPGWSEDFITTYLHGKLPIRNKSYKPVIGFCGQSKPLKATLKDTIKEFLIATEKIFNIKVGNLGSVIRAQALRLLSQSDLVTTNFVLRSNFIGGSQKKGGGLDFPLMQKVRQEYLENMINSDYILCCRGLGNYSFRLYETLCCGRIPIFINTDCVLPYDFKINYKKYCVWLEQKELHRLPEKVAEFHARLSPQDFINLQQECRQLWFDYLSPTGFFTHIHEHLENNL